MGCNYLRKLSVRGEKNPFFLVFELVIVLAAYKFDNSEQDDKRFILNKTGENYFLKDRKLQYDLKKPYSVFKDVSDGRYEKCNRLEPLKYADIIAKSSVSESENLSWLPLVDMFLNKSLILNVQFNQIESYLKAAKSIQ